MMAERHRLRRLQMREAWHDGRGMHFGFGCQNALQFGQRLVQPINLVAHIKLEIGRHLIVARPRRMQPSRRRSDDVLQPAFDVHVNVFERAGEHEFPALDFAHDLVETFADLARVHLRDDAGFGQHRRMRLRSADVLRRQPLVERDRRVDFLHDLGRRHRKPATPHLVGGFIFQGLSLRWIEAG